MTRLDLGSIRVPGLPGVEIQVNVDEASGAVVAVTAVHDELRAPAAGVRRSAQRGALAAGAARAGGRDHQGRRARRRRRLRRRSWRPGSIKARLPFPQPDGKTRHGRRAVRRHRRAAVDAARRAVRGRGRRPRHGGRRCCEVYRGTVVVRGGEAFAPSEPLPLHLPDQAQAGDQPAPGADRRRLDPEGTGQRIAEIR